MKNRTGSRYNQAGAVGRAAMVFYEIGSRAIEANGNVQMAKGKWQRAMGKWDKRNEEGHNCVIS